LTKHVLLGNFLAILIHKVEVFFMQEYEDLKVLVAEIEADIDKAEGGNKAAGTRVRKQMQSIKQAAQNVRNRILEIRSTQP
jgi:cell division septum initiation protein DivIVA